MMNRIVPGCTSCKQRYSPKFGQRPFILPCGHTQCENCLIEKTTVYCKDCKQNQEIQNYSETLKINYYVAGIEAVNFIESKRIEWNNRLKESGKIMADDCLSEQIDHQCCKCNIFTISECNDCNEFYCQDCFNQFHQQSDNLVVKKHQLSMFNRNVLSNEKKFKLCEIHDKKSPTCSGKSSQLAEIEGADASGVQNCLENQRDEDNPTESSELNGIMNLIESALMDCSDSSKAGQNAQKQIELYTRDAMDRVSNVFSTLHGALQNIEQQVRNEIEEKFESIARLLQAKHALLNYKSDLIQCTKRHCDSLQPNVPLASYISSVHSVFDNLAVTNMDCDKYTEDPFRFESTAEAFLDKALKESFQIVKVSPRAKLRNIFRTVIEIGECSSNEQNSTSDQIDEIDSSDPKVNIILENAEKAKHSIQNNEQLSDTSDESTGLDEKSTQGSLTDCSYASAVDFEQSDTETVIEQKIDSNLSERSDGKETELSDSSKEFGETHTYQKIETVSSSVQKDSSDDGKTRAEDIVTPKEETGGENVREASEDKPTSFVSSQKTDKDRDNIQQETFAEQLSPATIQCEHEAQSITEELGAQAHDDTKGVQSADDDNTKYKVPCDNITNDPNLDDEAQSQSVLEEMERNLVAYKHDDFSDKLEELTVESPQCPLHESSFYVGYAPPSKITTRSVEKYFKINAPNDVIVSFIKSPNHFYVQSTKYQEENFHFEKELLYEAKRSSLVTHWKVHDVYLIQMPQADTWYRGKLLVKDKNHDVWTVIYVDYGHQEQVHCSRIFNTSIPVRHHPNGAILCSLGHLKPSGVWWTTEALGLFSEMTTNKRLLLLVTDKKIGKHVYVDLLMEYSTGKGYVSIRDTLLFRSNAIAICYTTVFPQMKIKKKLCEPRKIKVPSCNVLKPGSSFEINMLRIVFPDKFYGMKTTELQFYADLQKRINDYYAKNGAEKVYLPDKGMPCVALIDQEWLRCVVSEVKPKEYCTVLLIDRGKEIYVHWTNLFRCSKKYNCSNVAAGAIKFKLKDIPTDDEDFCNRAIDWMEKKCRHNPQRVEILSGNPETGYFVDLFFIKPDASECHVNLFLAKKSRAVEATSTNVRALASAQATNKIDPVEQDHEKETLTKNQDAEKRRTTKCSTQKSDNHVPTSVPSPIQVDTDQVEECASSEVVKNVTRKEVPQTQLEKIEPEPSDHSELGPMLEKESVKVEESLDLEEPNHEADPNLNVVEEGLGTEGKHQRNWEVDTNRNVVEDPEAEKEPPIDSDKSLTVKISTSAVIDQCTNLRDEKASAESIIVDDRSKEDSTQNHCLSDLESTSSSENQLVVAHPSFKPHKTQQFKILIDDHRSVSVSDMPMQIITIDAGLQLTELKDVAEKILGADQVRKILEVLKKDPSGFLNLAISRNDVFRNMLCLDHIQHNQ